MPRAERTELTLHLHEETEKAILVSEDANHRHAVWLPLSQIEVTAGWAVNKSVTIECPEWLAIRAGLI